MDTLLNFLRIGAVPYLNAAPLTAHLPYANVLKASPQSLSGLLLDHALDAALVPSITALLKPDLNWVPHICIGSYGQVLSVILHHQVPISQIFTIALDQDSQTSVALTEIIFRLFRNQSIIFIEESHSDADAQLWIGDRALTLRQRQPHLHVLDLGEMWTEYTGLPFVYAAWAIHPNLSPQEKEALSSILQNAASRGLKERDQFATTALERQYLREHIRYTLDSKAIEGWQRFLHYAATLRKISSPTTLNFV